MKSIAFPLSLTWLSVGLFVRGWAGGTPSVDLGDSSTGNLVWGTYHYGFVEKDLDKALVYADKALNDVGAAMWAKGEILMENVDPAGAEEAFSMVVHDFGYAQIQDLGEWGAGQMVKLLSTAH